MANDSRLTADKGYSERQQESTVKDDSRKEWEMALFRKFLGFRFSSVPLQKSRVPRRQAGEHHLHKSGG